MLYDARTVVVFGIILQVVGFAKLLVIAAFYGAGPQLDAYYLGLVIPTFLIGLSSGVLQSSFVPLYVEARSRGEVASAARLRNMALTWTVTVLALGAAMLTLAREPALYVFGQLDPAQRRVLLSVIAILAWTAPLNGVADAMAILLNAEGRFLAAAAAPVVNAFVSILVLVLWHDGGLEPLVWGLIVGLVAQVAFVAVPLRRLGVLPRPAFAMPPGLSRSVMVIALPVLISNVLGNLVPALVQLMAARAGSGAVSAIGYATRLHNSVMQAVVMSVSLVLLPHFSRLLAAGRHEELRLTLERVFSAALLFFLAAVVFVFVSGSETVSVLLQRGRFTHADAELVASVWLALTLGLLGMTWGIFLARLFQARRQPWVIAVLAMVSVIVNVTLMIGLLPELGVVGVALANSAAYLLIMALFHRLAARDLGPLLSASSWRFILGAIGANLLGYAGCALWGALVKGNAVVVAITGNFVIIACANLLVARAPPLKIPVGALVRRWH